MPNFIKTEKFTPEYAWKEKTITYFGRLSKEKGLFTLIEAIRNIPDITLKIIGQGFAKEKLQEKIKSDEITNVKFLGYKTGEELNNEIRNSIFVVLPSECYENNPRSVIEAFALGKPVIGARIGGIPELVKDNETGLTFNPGDSKDLSLKIKELLDSPDEIRAMGKRARGFVETELNAEKHYQKLMTIYEKAKHGLF